MSEPQQATVLHGYEGPVAFMRRYWVTTIVVLVGLGWGVLWFHDWFYDTGYAPEQPIHYSHKLHAGQLGIDCKYCHFNAARGKHAGVPPMSVCIGCHKVVATTKPEIVKLTEIVDKGQYTDEEGIVHDGGVVHWKRVHKLPDFVYFSHQWHIAAGVACQTCHGPIQEMAVVRQFAPLTMGWCLDCHRSNAYVSTKNAVGNTYGTYDPSDPRTFRVGSPNYDVMRARGTTPDAVVEFVPRATKGNAGLAEAAGRGEVKAEPAHEGAAIGTDPVENLKQLLATTPKLREAMDIEKLKTLPRWRVANLPAAKGLSAEDLPPSHRQYYVNEADFVNAPTQCSTCHQ